MLIALAAMTSLLVVIIRKYTTNQDWLRRAHEDRRRLTQLTKAARRQMAAEMVSYDPPLRAGAKARYRDARARHRTTASLIKTRAARHELLPLLLSVVPIALLATWAFARVAFEPPKVGEEIEVRLYAPPAAIGQLAYIVPQAGIDSPLWVQSIHPDSPAPRTGAWDVAGAHLRSLGRAGYNFAVRQLAHVKIRLAPMTEPRPVPRGVAVWRIRATQPGDYTLHIRTSGRTYDRPFTAGTRRYAAPSTTYPGAPIQSIDLGLRETRLFGVIGGIDALWLAPWLVAYLLIAIPLVSLLKRLLRVY
jgi:hypothetical protein